MRTTVTFTTEVPMHRLLDLVISAIDSASILYWLRRYGESDEEVDDDTDGKDENYGCHYITNLPDGFDPNVLDWLEEPWDSRTRTDYFAPLVAGGTMTLFVDDDRDDGKDTIVLDLAAMQRGIQAMAEKEPRHFADLMSEDDDGITADVFMQCCAFGSVIYG